MIYTSYFAALKSIPEAIVRIGISRFPPKWYSGISYKKLAPTPEMLGMSIAEYNPRFEAILAALNPKQVAAEIETLARGQDAVLLCYEKPDEYCHRHLVRNWLNANGVFVEEYSATKHKLLYAPKSVWELF